MKQNKTITQKKTMRKSLSCSIYPPMVPGPVSWPRACGLNWYHLKLYDETKPVRKGVVLHFVSSFFSSVFLRPFMLSIVSKNGECVYFYEHHIKPKEHFATLFATCMSGGRRPRAGGARSPGDGIDAICHARLKVFHEMVEKGKQDGNTFYYEWQMFTY